MLCQELWRPRGNRQKKSRCGLDDVPSFDDRSRRLPLAVFDKTDNQRSHVMVENSLCWLSGPRTPTGESASRGDRVPSLTGRARNADPPGTFECSNWATLSSRLSPCRSFIFLILTQIRPAAQPKGDAFCSTFQLFPRNKCKKTLLA
jgi:hypothetical protein